MRGSDNMDVKGKKSFAHSEKNDKFPQSYLRFTPESDMILRNVKGGDFHGGPLLL